MGQDKGLVQLKGKCMIEHVLEVAKAVSEDLMIIANNSEYRNFGYTVFSDIYKQCGPLGGIYTGLVHSHSDYNLVLGCDLPFITQGIAKYVIGKSKGHAITIPVCEDKLEPLCAVYHKSCLEKFREFLLKKELKIIDIIRQFDYQAVDVTDRMSARSNVFSNINTQTDLLKAQEEKHEY